MAIAQLKWCVALNFINTYPANTEGSGLEPLRNNANNWKNKKINAWFNYFFAFFKIEYSKESFSQGDKYYKQYLNWSNNIVDFIEGIKSLLDNSPYVQILYKNRNLFYFNITDSIPNIPSFIDLELDISSKDAFDSFHKSFYNIYKKIIWTSRIDSMGFLDFEWRNISTGEKSLFTLFSRINSINFNINSINRNDNKHSDFVEIKSLILLLDEPDIGMHPEWQKKLLNIIIKSIPVLFKNIFSTQIIISTHSPFIASNLPVSNLIFLKKGANNNCIVGKNPLQDKKQTFASNIHTLFTDSFFMRDTLIGDFAKERINEVIDDLLSSESLSLQRIQEVRKIICVVGEPIIKRKLLQLYEDKFRLTTDTEIEKLSKRIDEIEKRLNDTN